MPASIDPAAAAAETPRVASGMRPTGLLHLGHYHGVLKNWVRLQQDYECFYFVADWHALTTHYRDNRQDLRAHLHAMVVDWIAAGVDPNKCTMFIQSRLPEHAELHLLLSMVTPLGWLERVPSFKDQQVRLPSRDLATYGFLGYPLLQAADILMYRADYVPVGEDQAPHVELSREIARRFNHVFGGTATDENPQAAGADNGGQPSTAILREPQVLLTPAARMPGLDGQKMSKSYDNTIPMRAPAKEVTQAIRTMPTDPARVRLQDPGEPEKCPVWQLHKVYSDQQTRDWVEHGCRAAAFGCLECKRPLINSILAEQEAFHERARPYQDRQAEVMDILEAGEVRARAEAEETMQRVRQAVGVEYQPAQHAPR